MRILHISDLHLTPPNKRFDDVWNGPAASLDGRVFDYIVVSGDLSQAASKEEYEQLEQFANDELLKLLAPRPGKSASENRTRIIFVPGNHDVEWSRTDVYGPIRYSSLPNDNHKTLSEHIATLKTKPGSGGARMFMGDLGHVEFLQIDEKTYRARFENVQRFLSSFYATGLGRAPCRPFNLLDPTGSGDWSAHVFPEDDLTFFGISSCERNDRYWHGAQFSNKAISEIRAHAERLRKDHPHMLFVGVWHHGFSSEVGRPDRLTLGDIGALYNTGVRLGFHGHTHARDARYHDLLGGRFAIIGTGSLGAGSGELPRGMDNQFAIASVYPTRVEVERFQLDHGRGVYASQAPDRIDLVRYAGPAESSRCRATMHSRAWRVNHDGIVEAVIELEGLSADATPTLAVVSPPFCNVTHGNAQTDRGDVRVNRIKLPDGRERFSPAELGFSSLKWSYQLSNAVALNRSELELLPDRAPWYTNLKAGEEDARSHTVRFDCDRLLMTLELERGIPEVTNARVLVEQRSDDGSEHFWRVDKRETARCEKAFLFDPTGRKLSLEVVAPIVGHRYSLVFTPADSSKPYPDAAKSLAKEVLSTCRRAMFDDCPLRDTLTAAIGQSMKSALKLADPLDPWLGLLWEPDRRKLFTGFGRFSARDWSVRFSAGNGVAGHAFRHGWPVAWHRAAPGALRKGRTETVFQDAPDNYEVVPHELEWVIALPLLLAKEGPCIGVVSLARRESETRGEKTLRALAEELSSSASGGPASGDPWRKLEDLVGAVNGAFWEALSLADTFLTEAQLEYAKGRRKALFGG